jgi:hypothetical protein
MSALGTDFVLLGIENQDKIHYAMPLRTMVYDAMGYVKQCKVHDCDILWRTGMGWS